MWWSIIWNYLYCNWYYCFWQLPNLCHLSLMTYCIQNMSCLIVWIRFIIRRTEPDYQACCWLYALKTTQYTTANQMTKLQLCDLHIMWFILVYTLDTAQHWLLQPLKLLEYNLNAYYLHICNLSTRMCILYNDCCKP